GKDRASVCEKPIDVELTLGTYIHFFASNCGNGEFHCLASYTCPAAGAMVYPSGNVGCVVGVKHRRTARVSADIYRPDDPSGCAARRDCRGRSAKIIGIART